MYPLAGIAGGVLATVGVLSLAVSGPASLNKVSAALTASAADTVQLDRSNKGDRLAINTSADPQEQAQVTTVEVVGVRNTAIVYRDRDGRVLFRTDPVANVTIVSKNVALPEVTVREHSEAVPTKMPVKTLQEGDKNRKLDGCDPVASPLAGSAVSQLVGRCIAGIAAGTKLAAAMPD
jgi:hypothetical protein